MSFIFTSDNICNLESNFEKPNSKGSGGALNALNRDFYSMLHSHNVARPFTVDTIRPHIALLAIELPTSTLNQSLKSM